MAPVPKKSMDDHFIHPGHTLVAIDKDQEYLCDGCKTIGNGKRYRCRDGCDFDMHEYCRNCPMKLSSFMHKHELSLVMRKAQSQRQVNRICDVCADPVEGLFYRCQDCEFDVHPLCTQLPRQLRHALDQIHALSLESLNQSRPCAVCKAECRGWRFRCAVCNLDIHLECVLVPVAVQCPQKPQSQTSHKKRPETNQRGIPMFNPGIPYRPPPPQYGIPYYSPAPYNFGHGFNMHYSQHMGMQPMTNYVPQYHHQVGVVGANQGTGNSKPGKSMFSLVGRLGFGVLSNAIFGVDVVSLFAS